MKKTLAVFLVLVLLLTAPLSGLASLKRGDKGNEVKQLQQLLSDLGFLNDKVDGDFGKNTEAAVKELQKYWGVEQTGVFQDYDMETLTRLWKIAMGEYEYGPLSPQEKEEYGVYCSWVVDEDGYQKVELCYRHYAQFLPALMLNYGPAPHKLEKLLVQQICNFWLKDIEEMYTEWEDQLDDKEKDIAREQKKLFDESLAENRKTWEKLNAKDDPNQALMQEMIWLEQMGVELCFDMHGAEANP